MKKNSSLIEAQFILKETLKENEDVLRISVEDIIGLNYWMIWSLDWDMLFIGGAKSTKKSRVIAAYILYVQILNPLWHATIIRSELKQHDETTIKAIGWMLNNKYKTFLPKIWKQYEYKPSDDRYVRYLPDGNKQYIHFKGIDKGLDKISGSDQEYGHNCLVWWNEPIHADDRFKRGGFDNAKFRYIDDIIISSLTRGCPRPKIIKDFNLHHSKNDLVQELNERVPVNREVLETGKGYQFSFDPEYMILSDINGKHTGFVKSLHIRNSYRVNEFMTDRERATVMKRKKIDPISHDVLDLGIGNESGAGIFSDLVQHINIYNSFELDSEAKNFFLKKIKYFNQGLDFGLTDHTVTILIGIGKNKELFILKTDYWEGQQYKPGSIGLEDAKISREISLANKTIWSCINNQQTYMNHISQPYLQLSIDYQHHHYVKSIKDAILKIENTNDVSLGWIQPKLQHKKFDYSIDQRYKILRLIFSRPNNFIDQPGNKKLIEVLETYRGHDDDKTWKQHFIDALWYAMVDFIEILLSTEELKEI